MVVFIYLAVFGSLMVSYTNARAKGLGIECKTGLLARPERVILLAIGLLSNTDVWALALLAVLSNVTAVERIIAVWRSTRQPLEVCDQRYYRRQTASMDNRRAPTTFMVSEVNNFQRSPCMYQSSAVQW
ncbi:hypothetical protein [Dictyobacter kobayashii]|uniref:Uncharacterized protein n=1 Tax=Dictyobacter kobayashii TaxID=2014872 RepID=A0A402AJC3_9CHLR|nr:hypothetical protein [Dictyobacter kobayashii]GCE19202.1 hypothetical protein KDK_30020 [Dictyobacter kobayashii]